MTKRPKQTPDDTASKTTTTPVTISPDSIVAPENFQELDDMTALEEIDIAIHSQIDTEQIDTEQQIENLFEDTSLLDELGKGGEININNDQEVPLLVDEFNNTSKPQRPFETTAIDKTVLQSITDHEPVPVLDNEVATEFTTLNKEEKMTHSFLPDTDDGIKISIEDVAAALDDIDNIPSELNVLETLITSAEDPQEIQLMAEIPETALESTQAILDESPQLEIPTDMASYTTVQAAAEELIIDSELQTPEMLAASTRMPDNDRPIKDTPPMNNPTDPATSAAPNGLHAQLSQKIDALITDATSTLTTELHTQLPSRLEDILLNTIDTILPPLFEKFSDELHNAVENDIKQQLPYVINEILSKATHSSNR